MKNLIKLFLALALVTSLANAFEAKFDKTTVNGVSFYLLPDGDEPNEDGLIDQFWLLDLVNKNAVPKGIHIVDVRSEKDHKAFSLKGAINVPWNKESESIDTSKLPKDGIIVFHCKKGLMSMDARNSLEDELLERTFVFDISVDCDKETGKNCKVTANEVI